jgi:hypothetical protein
MLIAAGHWYGDGSFWQFAITTVVAVVIGALGAFATMRASNPKRELTWSTFSDSILGRPLNVWHNGVTVTYRYQGTEIENPRLVGIRMRNTGRRDITTALFDGGRPIRFSVIRDAEPVAVTEVAKWGAAADPEIILRDGRIEVHPMLLRAGQEIAFGVLVTADAGGGAEVMMWEMPLIDVRVREGASRP